jgi:hypothetical protein
MSIRLASYVIIPVVFLAGGWALHGADRAPDVVLATPQATSPALTMGEVLPSGDGETLPPNHPPIGGAGAPHGSMPSAAADPPALTWKIPEGWQEAPSPNAMRLATYKVPGGVEVSISRAGGATEANIQRWVGQFDNVGREVHAEKTVHGVRVVTVDVAGTFVGGGMSAGTPAEPRPDWAMVGAVLESRTPPYFFKMTGPAAAVHAAHPAFDRLVDTITPT